MRDRPRLPTIQGLRFLRFSMNRAAGRLNKMTTRAGNEDMAPTSSFEAPSFSTNALLNPNAPLARPIQMISITR